MAVIAVTADAPGNETIHWAVPPETSLSNSPVPRGNRVYQGGIAVAALGAGDETNVEITFTFPNNFCYLCKSMSISFLSDDLTTEFSNQGILEYRPGASGSLSVQQHYQMVCDAPGFRLAVRSMQTYAPIGTWRHWIYGKDGDELAVMLADISGDTSTAGDIVFDAEFWEYDIEQCLKWPINTPAPQFSY